MDRKYSFAVLLVVVAASVVFGMILGGRLNAPATMLAATDTAWLEKPPEATLTADIAEKALPAVVGVQNTSIQKLPQGGQDPHHSDPFFRWFYRSPDSERRSVGFGSGFIISDEGYILTNNHVVEGATKLTVETKNGEKYDAILVGADPSIDLALIKIDPEGATLPTLPLGDSAYLRVGEWVLAIGNPLGLDYTVTAGVVSAKGRDFPIGGTLSGVASFIQTDAAINKGNSGGPLLDANGQVIGINTAIYRGGGFGGMGDGLVEGVGFALPINAARDAVEQILETGSVQRGFLGITMNQFDLDEDARDYYGLPDTHGVEITEVQDEMPAEKAGVRANDIIRQVDGQDVANKSDLLSKIATRRPGETVELTVFRDGKTLDIGVKLTSRAEGMAARGSGESRPGREPEPEQPVVGLGIEVDDIPPAARDQLELDDDVEGVMVVGVDAASAAADKLIGPGMIITGLNDKPIRNVPDWNGTMRKLEVGDPVKVEIWFRGQILFAYLKVTAEE